MVKISEISDEKNDYNLNLPRYIDSSEPEDIQDIDGHLNGGIPDHDINLLSAYWDVIPGVRSSLLEAIRDGYSQLRVPVAEAKQTIYDHEEFAEFIKSTTAIFTMWKEANHPRLSCFNVGDKPKQLIETISEELLATFETAPLLDAYDIYQHLMEYWDETMQDDCYLISADGWVAKPETIWEIVRSGRRSGERRSKGWYCDLVPKPLVVARYFAAEQEAIDAMEDELVRIDSEMEEIKEEHGGEEGIMKDVSSKTDAQLAYTEAIVPVWNEEAPEACSQYSTLSESVDELSATLLELGGNGHFSERRNKNGSVGLAKVKARLKEIGSGDEYDVLTEYVSTEKEQRAIAKKAKQMLEAAESDIIKRLGEEPLPDGYEELEAIVRYLELLEQESKLKSEKRAAENTLDQLAYDKYSELSVDDIKSLVVDDKWMSFLREDLQSEVYDVSVRLTGTFTKLAARYSTALPELTKELESLSKCVLKHLKRMEAA